MRLRKIEKNKIPLRIFLRKNWALMLAIFYFFLPIDIIPDVIPVFGLGDDILVLLATFFIRYRKFTKTNKNEIIEGELVDE